jgi:predicted ATPase
VITLSLAGAPPLLGAARVWFDSLEATVECRPPNTLAVTVPQGISIPEPRIRVAIGRDEATAGQPFFVSREVTQPQPVEPSRFGGGLLLAALLVALALLLISPQLNRPLRRLLSKTHPTEDSVPAPSTRLPAIPERRPSEVELDLPELQVPDDLVDACLRSDCVLYAGGGLSARANLPLWRPFITDLLEWSIAQGLVDADFGGSLRSALGQGQVDRVADGLVSRVHAAKGLEALSEHIREIVATAESEPLPDVLISIPQIGFGAALTTNFDHLLERAFGSAKREVAVRLPRDVEAIRGDLSRRQFFILKLYGDVDRPDSLILSPAQYEEAIQGDRPFADVMQELFLTRTILFLGSSLEGMDAYLRGLRFQPMTTPRHYAVVAVSGQEWKVAAEGLSRRYGIQILPYSERGLHAPLPRFVEALAQSVAMRTAHVEASAPGARPAVVTKADSVPLLRSLELKNIGPFEEIHVQFDQKWTVLLGDNGVGKSTILKAVALAVAGEHAGPAAGRLLRAGSRQGQITLRTTTDTRYVTQVFTNTLGRPEARSIGARAFAQTLVIGFPPARAIAAGPATPGQGIKGSESPLPSDVLPLLSGLVDPRILDIKQWIVNLDYRRARSESEESKGISDLLDDYFRMMSRLLDIDVHSWRIADNDVRLTTVDGEIPLDGLSQGTVSAFGWVGVVLQRAFDIFGRPQGPAIVLLDEIDAHMHPEWQQKLGSRLASAFPEVQFVVTTHSPFLAIGRSASEVIHIRRDSRTGKLLAESPAYDTTHVGAGGALTSPLFGLQTLLAPSLQADLLTRRRLSGKTTLTAEETGELSRISATLAGLDPSESIQDPLIKAFVREMNRRSQALSSAGEPTPFALEQQTQWAREVLDEIIDGSESAAPSTPAIESVDAKRARREES